jgi:peptidoglycan/xylan/chitin deacetylase (PgdA/CDA1 family)
MSATSMSQRIRSALKQIVLAILYYSGALWLLAWFRLRNRTLVLTYHRVLPLQRWPDSFSSRGIIVTPETFDLQLRFLRGFLKPLSASEFIACLQSGRPMPSRSCLVTFDDGWYDTLEFALPALRRHGVPAVLFVAADYVGTGRCFWQERLARRLFELRNRPEVPSLLAAAGLSAADDRLQLSDRDAIRELVTRLKELPSADVDSLMARLAQLAPAGSGPGEDRFLDWAGVAELCNSRQVEIGSHALSHRPLTRISPDEAGRELRQSREILRSRLGTEARLLAYPNGDATPEIAGIASATGFAAAFTTERGAVAAGGNPHLLQRVNIHEASTPTRPAFFGRLLGLT